MIRLKTIISKKGRTVEIKNQNSQLRELHYRTSHNRTHTDENLVIGPKELRLISVSTKEKDKY